MFDLLIMFIIVFGGLFFRNDIEYLNLYGPGDDLQLLSLFFLLSVQILWLWSIHWNLEQDLS